MKERPILFSPSMVNATLQDLKSQTRRTLDTFRGKSRYDGVDDDDQLIHWFEGLDKQGQGTEIYTSVKCPYGRVGDRLWGRENWRCGYPTIGHLQYRADNKISALGDNLCKKYANEKWRPSIHMPRWASRITLEITNVRIERLQDITEEDAKAEGIELLGFRELDPTTGQSRAYTHKDHFEALWESINGEGSWRLNPWVWVIEFRRAV